LKGSGYGGKVMGLKTSSEKGRREVGRESRRHVNFWGRGDRKHKKQIQKDGSRFGRGDRQVP